MSTFKTRLMGVGILVCLSITLLTTSNAQTFNRNSTYNIAIEAIKEKLERHNDPNEQLERPDKSRDVLELRNGSDANVTESEESESEVHAALNPVDSNNIIVGAMKWSPGSLLALSFTIYYTEDFGQTWQESSFDGTPPGSQLLGGGDPIIAFDSEGTAYFFWLTVERENLLDGIATLQWAISTDRGATWEIQETPIDAGSFSNILIPTSGDFVDKEWVAVDNSNSAYKDNIYIAYAALDIMGDQAAYEIRVKKKTPEAKAFTDTFAIASVPEMVFSQFSSIDVDDEGTVHLMFMAAMENDSITYLFHTKSTDGGESFSTPTKISALHVPCFPPGANTECVVEGIDPNRMYPCPHIRVDRSGGSHNGYLYAVWTADGLETQATTGVDIYFSKSMDGGTSWSSPLILNNDADPSLHQFFPSLHVNDNGTVIMTWYDRREDENNIDTKYFMTYSTDGGETFIEDFAVSTVASDFSAIGSANGNFGVGEYTQVIATSSYAIPFWSDGRSNDGNIEVFTSFIPLFEDPTVNTVEIGTISTGLTITGPSPNPSSDQSELVLNLDQAAQLSITLYNAQGQLVKRVLDPTNLPAGNHQYQIATSELAVGTYLIAINSDVGFRTKPLIVGK